MPEGEEVDDTPSEGSTRSKKSVKTNAGKDYGDEYVEDTEEVVARSVEGMAKESLGDSSEKRQ